MAKVLVLYYSTYGHIETMANAVAEGARGAGAQVDIRRVPELVPPEVAKNAHFKLDQAAPVASVAELAGLSGMSASHFHACFLREVGAAPMEYSHRARLARAGELHLLHRRLRLRP